MDTKQNTVRDEIADYICGHPENILTRAKKRGYICPLCGNGRGEDGTGIEKDNRGSVKRPHYKCFRCGFYGDMIELVAQMNGISNGGSAEAFEAARKAFGIDPAAFTSSKNKPAPASTAKDEDPAGESASYTEFYKEAAKSLHLTEYYKSRGLSQSTAEKYNLGFVENWAHPKREWKGEQEPRTPRLIIPIHDGGYLARCTRPLTDAEKAAGIKEKMFVGKKGIFNSACLRENQDFVVITEGELDALSFSEAGVSAAALGSTSGAKQFIAELAAARTSSFLVLWLDNDVQGDEASKYIAKELENLKIPFVRVVGTSLQGHQAFDGIQIRRQCHDPNQYLQEYRGDFLADVRAMVCAYDNWRRSARGIIAPEDNLDFYLREQFQQDVEMFKRGSERKTGFEQLDKLIGGIYPGLYAVGAVSSLGKTTFIHQLCDQMAERGEHILFFSLEMSRLEMVTKSISRRTALNNFESGMTSLSIRKGFWPYNVQEAIKEYSDKVGNRMNIVEGNLDCTASFIGEYIDAYKRQNGDISPVVVVDYLQVMTSNDKSKEGRHLVDANIVELKRLSREYCCPVFVISSLNRSSYLAPVDFESFKESGGIEYTVDALWGLQLEVVRTRVFDANGGLKQKRDALQAAKTQSPRKMELVLLKNRSGIAPATVKFDYYPQFDLYKEAKK